MIGHDGKSDSFLPQIGGVSNGYLVLDSFLLDSRK